MIPLKKMLILSSCLLSPTFASDNIESPLSPEPYESSSKLQNTISMEELEIVIEEIIHPQEASGMNSVAGSVKLQNSPSSSIPKVAPKASFHLPTIQQIQQKLLRKGISLDNLEGGYVLMFDTSGQLTNPKACHRTQILHGLLYASPDAYLVQGLSLQSQQDYGRAFDYFLIAASGSSGVSQATCGGTSSELAFYNMFQLLSAKGFKDATGEIVYSHKFDKYQAEDYKKFTTPIPILQKQLESLLATVKKQSHKKEEILPSVSPSRNPLLSILSPRSSPLTHTQSSQDLESKKQETKSKSGKSARTTLAALLSPRGHRK